MPTLVIGGPRTEDVMRDTWGYMNANPGTRYNGHILFAEGAFGGDRIILEAEFGNAGYGPWFYEGIMSWLCDQEMGVGRIYRFDGFYRLASGGSHEFVGNITSTTLEVTE
jgi:hypothetical protein